MVGTSQTVEVVMPYTDPRTVHSPRARWHLHEVIMDRGENSPAYALGTWDRDRRIGFRWNGNDENPNGNPQSRGLPTWTMLDEHLHEAVVMMLPVERRAAARAYLDLPPVPV